MLKLKRFCSAFDLSGIIRKDFYRQAIHMRRLYGANLSITQGLKRPRLPPLVAVADSKLSGDSEIKEQECDDNGTWIWSARVFALHMV